MLKVPELNDITYEQIVQHAVQKIPVMTDQWTDFNDHDPGITVLQTYAWLVDMLDYYMNATGDVHIEKYLKLLGFRAKEAKAAEAYLNVESQQEELELLEGTPAVAGDIPFEIEKTQRVLPNRFTSCLNEVDGTIVDMTMLAGVDGTYAELFAREFVTGAAAYFGFEREFSGKLRMQICVRENGKRNPVPEKFSMSSLIWQYYGAEGWKNLNHVEDGTCGLLKSGIVTAELPEEAVTCQLNLQGREGHYLRCVLKKNTYDRLPEIGRIYVNPVLAEQKQTLSREIRLVYQGEPQMTIPCYIPADAYLMVGVLEQENAGHLIYDEAAEHDWGIEITQGAEPCERILTFSKQPDWLKEGDILHIFVVQESFLSEFQQGRTDGCAGQRISFPYEGIYRLAVTTWKQEKDGRHSYESWSYTPSLELAGYRDKVFTYDTVEKMLVFGDGEHGAVPEPGQLISITGLSVSRFGEGNVLEQEIRKTGEVSEDVKITNPFAAAGGRGAEQMKALLKRMQEEIFRQKRLVSVEDYKETVLHTPGLMIEEVQVLSGKRYGEIHSVNWRENEVVVVVKPWADRKRPVLSSFYRDSIEKYLEGLRLINTKVTVVSPSYVGIEVNGKIRLAHKTQREQEQVLLLLKEMILMPKETSHFGKTLVLGRLFSMLELSDAVERVESLSLERMGLGAEKNQRGDIILYEDALCYISDINLEFC